MPRDKDKMNILLINALGDVYTSTITFNMEFHCEASATSGATPSSCITYWFSYSKTTGILWMEFFQNFIITYIQRMGVAMLSDMAV